jgi:hypothetical protein
MDAEASVGGLTIPTRNAVGHHDGTGDFLPFLDATIARIVYH